MLNYSETLVTVGSHSYWKLHCFPTPWTGWSPLFLGFFDTWWYFILARHTFWLSRKGPCKILHRQCMWSMLCCYKNEHQKVCIMLFYYVLAFGVEFSNFHQNLARALHCHDSWGFTSLSTVMICRLLVIFLYLFLNIPCGYLVLSLQVWISVSKMVELLWMLQMDKGIKIKEIYPSPNPSTDATANNRVYSA